MRKKSKINWKNIFIIVLFEILLIANIVLAKMYYDAIDFCKLEAYTIEISTNMMSKIGGKK